MRVALISPAIRVEDAYRRPAEHLFRQSGENTGNFAFVQALYGHLLPDVTMFPWFAPAESVREQSDVVVMACANQLGPHTDLRALADWFEKIDLPIVAIGLGAQSPKEGMDVELKEGTARWLATVAGHAPSSKPNIGMRGEFSRRQVELAGFGDKAVITGCPSNFLNQDPFLGRKIEQRKSDRTVERVAVCAGFYKWKNLEAIEQNLVSLVDKTRGMYVTQSQLEMIQIARNEFSSVDPAVVVELNKYIHPTLSPEQFQAWCRRYAFCFKDATSWMDIMTLFDFVVGARFHGIMLAMQAGVPGGVISHDSRTTELCRTMRIPVLSHDEAHEPFTEDNLNSRFPFDGDAYDKNRQLLWARYHDVMAAAGIRLDASAMTPKPA